MGAKWGKDDWRWALPSEEWGKEGWRDDNSWIYEEQAAKMDRESGRVPGGPKVGGGCGTCLACWSLLILIMSLLAMRVG